MRLLSIVSIISTCVRGIKEAFEPTIPAENWANRELMDKDRSRGMSEQEISKNIQRGRYIMTMQYPIPHRETTGNKRINIENCELYNADVSQYGAHQAHEWMRQGKYNLTPEELEITHLQYEKKQLEMYALVTGMNPERKERIEEIKKILATKNWDCRKTEALQQWQRAHDANVGSY